MEEVTSLCYQFSDSALHRFFHLHEDLIVVSCAHLCNYCNICVSHLQNFDVKIQEAGLKVRQHEDKLKILYRKKDQVAKEICYLEGSDLFPISDLFMIFSFVSA